MIMKTNLGDGIRRLREALHLTQEQTAEILDCCSATVSRWETGVKIPSRTTIEKIYALIQLNDLDPADFFMDELEEVDKLQQDKDDLECLINTQNISGLERKLDEFQNNMDKDSVDDKQYFLFGQLMSLKLSGQLTEDFIEHCKKIYSMSGDLPDINELSTASLTNIQQLILIKMGQHYIDMDEWDKGDAIIKKLILRYGSKTCLNCKNNDRMLDVSALLAQSFYKQGKYDMSIVSCNYIFEKLLQDPRFYFFKEALLLGCQIYMEKGPLQLAEQYSAFTSICDTILSKGSPNGSLLPNT